MPNNIGRVSPSKHRNLLSDSLHGGSVHYKSDKEQRRVLPWGEPMVKGTFLEFTRSLHTKEANNNNIFNDDNNKNTRRDASSHRENVFTNNHAAAITTGAQTSPCRLSMNDLPRHLRSHQQCRRAYQMANAAWMVLKAAGNCPWRHTTVVSSRIGCGQSRSIERASGNHEAILNLAVHRAWRKGLPSFSVLRKTTMAFPMTRLRLE